MELRVFWVLKKFFSKLSTDSSDRPTQDSFVLIHCLWGSLVGSFIFHAGCQQQHLSPCSLSLHYRAVNPLCILMNCLSH